MHLIVQLLAECLTWACANLAPLINSVGLVFELVGAFFVAYEVVQQFRGEKICVDSGWVTGPHIVDQEVDETPDFHMWESKKYRSMKYGLLWLTVGLLLQLVSNWVK